MRGFSTSGIKAALTSDAVRQYQPIIIVVLYVIFLLILLAWVYDKPRVDPLEYRLRILEDDYKYRVRREYEDNRS